MGVVFIRDRNPIDNDTSFGGLGDNVFKDTEGYSGSAATFIWNNLNNDEVEYIIESSVDGLDYKPLSVSINGKDNNSFNIIHKGVLMDPNINSARRIYYRVKAVTSEAICYSDVISFIQYNKLGNIENLKVNGERKVEEVDLEEGDVLKLTWDNTYSKAIYTALVSFDGVNWVGLNTYNQSSDIDIVDDDYECVIPINYTRLFFYFKVEAILNGAKSESKVITVNVKIDDLFPDDVAVFLNDYYNVFINEMNIYN